MKNFLTILKQNTLLRICILITTLPMSLFHTYSQEYSSVSGFLADNASKESIPFANTALFKLPDSVLFSGQISDTSGHFRFERVPAGNYLLIVSMIGYETFMKEVVLNPAYPYDAGEILLNGKTTGIREVFVTADRLKGKSDKDKTLYFVTKRMSDVSANGLELVKLIPGVQVDMRRNVSIEGSQNVLILVDGIERDNNYLSQIRSEIVDRVEILNAPPSKYDGNYTGVINVILKKERSSGISGRINMEIPGTGSKYFNHPDFNISFGFKKLNIYTSYNGELISFKQTESLVQRFVFGGAGVEAGSDQFIVQKLRSHRFHYGFDLPLSSHTKINVYGFYNPYSQKYSGFMDTYSVRTNEEWNADRMSENRNKSTYYSVFFNHRFNDNGSDLSVDFSNYFFSGENTAIYSSNLSETGLSSIINASRPELRSSSAKIDMNTIIGQNIKISFGTRLRSQTMKERNVKQFHYAEKTYAAYGSTEYNTSGFNISLGLRIEQSVSELKNVFDNSKTLLLPYALVNLKISPDKNLKAGFNKNIHRPNLYQLNPAVSMDDPNNFRYGNPFLRPEVRSAYFLEYSRKFKSSYFSSRIFYNCSGQVISSLSYVNDTSMIGTTFENAGSIVQTGFQASGTLRLGSAVSFMPYLKIYANLCKGNHPAKEYYASNRKQVVVEPGFSSIISFKYDIHISMNLQYASPVNALQGTSFSDAFYSISLEKVFRKKLNVGIVSALPFASSFIYQGKEINSSNLYSKYTGKIDLSGPLFWIKLGYQFNAGKKFEKNSRTVDENEILPNKSF